MKNSILAYLADHGPVCLSKIGKAINVNPAHLGTLVGQLLRAGRVSRRMVGACKFVYEVVG